MCLVCPEPVLAIISRPCHNHAHTRMVMMLSAGLAPIKLSTAYPDKTINVACSGRAGVIHASPRRGRHVRLRPEPYARVRKQLEFSSSNSKSPFHNRPEPGLANRCLCHHTETQKEDPLWVLFCRAIVSVNVAVGDEVVEGQEVAIIEAMKMQNVLRVRTQRAHTSAHSF
jgi:biotin carboxyl carrier protein